jgi:hypothetical protein
MVNVPVDVIVPATSPSMTNSLPHITSPLMETSPDNRLGAEL